MDGEEEGARRERKGTDERTKRRKYGGEGCGGREGRNGRSTGGRERGLGGGFCSRGRGGGWGEVGGGGTMDCIARGKHLGLGGEEYAEYTHTHTHTHLGGGLGAEEDASEVDVQHGLPVRELPPIRAQHHETILYHIIV
jgi:hypothetical protein